MICADETMLMQQWHWCYTSFHIQKCDEVSHLIFIQSSVDIGLLVNCNELILVNAATLPQHLMSWWVDAMATPGETWERVWHLTTFSQECDRIPIKSQPSTKFSFGIHPPFITYHYFILPPKWISPKSFQILSEPPLSIATFFAPPLQEYFRWVARSQHVCRRGVNYEESGSFLSSDWQLVLTSKLNEQVTAAMIHIPAHLVQHQVLLDCLYHNRFQ